jgi:glycosyltransferase involved in cell wall biosynthesis
LVSTDCDPVKIPHVPMEPSLKYGKLKYLIAKYFFLYFWFEILRGVSFFRKTKNCDVIHFDQVLKAFGFLSLLTLIILSKRKRSKIFVTVNEIDPIQLKFKRLNKFYNCVEKIIVHSKSMKSELASLGVDDDKIVIVFQGVNIKSLKNFERDRLIFFGGHKILQGKGFETLLDALNILAGKKIDLKVVIYTGEGCIGLDEAKRLSHQRNLSNYLVWSHFMHGEQLSEAFQKSFACIIPYTRGSGIHPAINAMANATPVIATRRASIPEYLGKHGIYVKEDSPEDLANAILSLMNQSDHGQGEKSRIFAQKNFSWKKISETVFEIYDAQRC